MGHVKTCGFIAYAMNSEIQVLATFLGPVWDQFATLWVQLGPNFQELVTRSTNGRLHDHVGGLGRWLGSLLPPFWHVLGDPNDTQGVSMIWKPFLVPQMVPKMINFG